jgi:outer membrane usher protein
LLLAILTIPLFPQSRAAESFNSAALDFDNPTSASVDLTQFAVTGAQAPGTYRADVFMNGKFQSSRDISFVLDVNHKLQPQLTPGMLSEMGVLLSSVPNLSQCPEHAVLDNLVMYIPQATTTFDFARQRLAITVPQALMNPSVQGSLDEKYWDEGIPVLMTNYNFTGSTSWQSRQGGRTDSYFLGLRNGVNLNAWRLRNYSTGSYTQSRSQDKTDDQQSHWDPINTYLQRDIPVIKGQFIAGDSYTPSTLFDSVQFRGIQLASDDNMLPESQRGFAPTVKGIANSNAQVTVKQNGSVIYQTYVPPGAFTLSDLYPTSSGGDLVVEVKESNGNQHTFIQSFSDMPGMQREGRLKYAVTTGKYRTTDNGVHEPIFGQISLLYGLPMGFTVYGGSQGANSYHSLSGGVVLGMGPAGAVSLDDTWSRLKNDSTHALKEGHALRFQYATSLPVSHTTITFAGYRYSSPEFYSLTDAISFLSGNAENDTNDQLRKRSKLQLDLSQNLMNGNWGSLSISGYRQRYWNENGYECNLSLGYSNIWNKISWSLMYTFSVSPEMSTHHDQQLALNMSIPLEHWLSGASFSNNMTSDMHGSAQGQSGVSGTMLDEHNLSYNLSRGIGSQGLDKSGLVSLDYKGSYGELNAGYNYNQNSKQINYGLQGMALAHSQGVTFGQSIGDSMASLALVRAPGANGVKIQNNAGIYTDWRGYTIVPYLSSYKRNHIALDPATFGPDVDLQDSVKIVLPTAGAVVLADFMTHTGSRVMMTLRQGEHVVPFGATVSLDSDDTNTGIVGDEGQVYLSGIPENGSLSAKWGKAESQQCHAHFNIRGNPSSRTARVQQITTSCS